LRISLQTEPHPPSTSRLRRRTGHPQPLRPPATSVSWRATAPKQLAETAALIHGPVLTVAADITDDDAIGDVIGRVEDE